MSLIFDSYSYKYGDYGLNNGSIFDITISGSSSYSSIWYGPTDRFGSIGVVSGFTNLSNIIKHPDLVNLYPGVYSGYSHDNSVPSSSASTTIEILEREKLLLDVSLYDDSCLNDDSLFCTLRVNDFNHDVNNFVYNLYVNDSSTPVKVYNGSKGHELYDFTGLTANNKYNIEAYETDEIVYMYKNVVDCIDSDIDIKNGTDPVNIVNNWDKVSLMSEKNIPIYRYYDISLQFIKSGLEPDGIIDSGNPNNWFYTGTPETSNVWFSSGGTKINYYLGAYGKTDFVNDGIMQPEQVMVEGMNIGPRINGDVAPFSSQTFTTAYIGTYGYRFYYNTDINKFLIAIPTHGISGNNRINWCTFDPRNDYGSIGNPTTTTVLTSDVQWGTRLLDSNQYTTSGETDTVVLATDKLDITGSTIVGLLNTNIISGFVSGCGFSNYKHDITIGSESSNDNDILGIILASFRDDTGVYGASGVTHNISLSVSRSSNIYENIKGGCTVHHNLGTSAYGFSGDTDNIILSSSTYPFEINDGDYQWDNGGYMRISITRSDKVSGSGNGELFLIEMSKTMGPDQYADIKPYYNNPYYSGYTLSFDISDSSTWKNNGVNTNLNHADQPNALMKFIGPQKYGYYSISQPNAMFFDITFSGSQRSIRPTIQTLVASAKDDETIPIIPYDLNCEYIETICFGDFDSTTDLYIDVLDNTNNPSVTFDLTSSVIPDPCPSVVPNICGCPYDVCNQSIRVEIKRKQ